MERTEFEQLALEELDAVYRMAMQLARHPNEASDLVQETFLKALKAAASFHDQGRGVRPWLFKILHNVFYTKARRDKRGPISVDEFHDASSQPPPDASLPAWDLEHFDWEQVDDRLLSAVEELRPEYRSILLLWGVEGMKYREIAEIQDIPIGTVMSRLHRARSILSEQLREFAEEIGFGERSPG